jgi:hypothetical protein
MTPRGLQPEDVSYIIVRTPEWGGSVRLASAPAEAVLDFLESSQSVASRNLRLLVRSIVDKDGKRVRPVDVNRRIAAFRRKDGKTVQRLVEAAIELNGVYEERKLIKNASGEVATAASPIG